MIAMIEITPQHAELLKFSGEVYQLFDDGSESLVEYLDSINPTYRYGIEGELFGEPYGYERIEHDGIKCSEWGDEVLRDEDGNCSLCGGLIK
jgi:hypothetical protein